MLNHSCSIQQERSAFERPKKTPSQTGESKPSSLEKPPLPVFVGSPGQSSTLGSTNPLVFAAPTALPPRDPSPVMPGTTHGSNGTNHGTSGTNGNRSTTNGSTSAPPLVFSAPVALPPRDASPAPGNPAPAGVRGSGTTSSAPALVFTAPTALPPRDSAAAGPPHAISAPGGGTSSEPGSASHSRTPSGNEKAFKFVQPAQFPARP
jgi:hypothetical protein